MTFEVGDRVVINAEFFEGETGKIKAIVRQPENEDFHAHKDFHVLMDEPRRHHYGVLCFTKGELSPEWTALCPQCSKRQMDGDYICHKCRYGV